MPPSRRDDLIDAAMKVFGRWGFRSTGLDKVLAEGGISRMTLYNHFKSKDELIVAALRRRDELFRNHLMKEVESRSSDPVERLLAIFDVHGEWFAECSFCGCMFIKAASEFCDTTGPVRRLVAEHKMELVRYMHELCAVAGVNDPAALSEQLFMLLEGSVIYAQLVGQVGAHDVTPEHAAAQARCAATALIESARNESTAST